MQKPVPYAKAFAARPPREVVIGIAKDPQGKYNPITLGMFAHVANSPPVLAVSIAKEQYSLAAFRLAREFVIALPSEGQAEETMLYGTKSGRDCDKLALAQAKTRPATKIDCVLLEDAAANYECRLIGRDKLTVSRWECGTLSPGPQALAKLYALARKRKEAGVVLAG